MDWFKSYLEGRHQVTKLEGSLSVSSVLTCGDPQGSVLGPLLFTLYVNDIPDINSQYHTYLYPDGTSIEVSSDDDQELGHLKIALKNISRYFTINKLSLNCTKSNVMCYGTSSMISKIPEMNIVHNSTRCDVKLYMSVSFLGSYWILV